MGTIQNYMSIFLKPVNVENLKNTRGNMKKRKKYRKKRKYFIEILSNKRGWTKVEFLGYTKSGKIIIKYKDKSIVKRKAVRIRWVVTKRVSSYLHTDKSWGSDFKTKKKRRKKSKMGKPKKQSKLKVLKKEARAKLERPNKKRK